MMRFLSFARFVERVVHGRDDEDDIAEERGDLVHEDGLARELGSAGEGVVCG
jgi:hypothetical protein